MSKIKKTDLLTLLQEQAEMIVELSSMIKMNKQSIIKLENEREQNSLIERDIAKELLGIDLSGELTGSELCKAMLARGDKYISGFGHHHSDALALQSKFADTVSKHTQCFQSSQNAWDYFVPINNQGEPLTASEVGL